MCGIEWQSGESTEDSSRFSLSHKQYILLQVHYLVEG